MEIPASLIYYLYLILVGIFFIFSFFNIYHLLRFGSPRSITYLVTALYLIVSVLILIASWSVISAVSWGQSLPLLPQSDNFLNL